MSGPSLAEFLILCLIGLIVLGPKRLPEVANQIGKWVGQARRMTRVMKRQLEDELDLEKQLDIKPTIHAPPRDDDNYSPLHSQPAATPGVKVETRDQPTSDDSPDDEAQSGDDSEQQQKA